jgi:hypothetical protein
MKKYKVEFKYSEKTYHKNRESYIRDFNINILNSDEVFLNEFEIALIRKNKSVMIGETLYDISDIIFKLKNNEKSVVMFVKYEQDDDLPF